NWWPDRQPNNPSEDAEHCQQQNGNETLAATILSVVPCPEANSKADEELEGDQRIAEKALSVMANVEGQRHDGKDQQKSQSQCPNSKDDEPSIVCLRIAVVSDLPCFVLLGPAPDSTPAEVGRETRTERTPRFHRLSSNCRFARSPQG